MGVSKSYTLGLVFIFIVAILWSLSSIVAQYLYQELSFNSPFILTYIGTSLFVIFIPTKLISERWHKCTTDCLFSLLNGNTPGFREQGSSEMLRHGPNAIKSAVIPWRKNGKLITSQIGDTNDSLEMDVMRIESEPYSSIELRVDEKGTNGFAAVSILEETTVNYQSQPEYASLMLHSDENKIENRKNQPQRLTLDLATQEILSHVQHLTIALKIAPVWFLSNFAYNYSLEYTTITASTVLSSTGSLFSFLFALIVKEETCDWFKLFGVLLGLMGSYSTTLGGPNLDEDINTNSTYFSDSPVIQLDQKGSIEVSYIAWGNLAGLISAIGYGVYTVLLRTQCPRDEALFSMSLILGYIGLTNMILLSPFAIWTINTMESSSQNHDGVNINSNDENSFLSQSQFQPTTSPIQLLHDNTQHLTGFILMCLILKGLVDNVISDYLWARSVILTSATVATVGLGLTIPFAFLSDVMIMGRKDVWNLQNICGAMMVLAGFGFVNIGENKVIASDVDNENELNDENVQEVLMD